MEFNDLFNYNQVNYQPEINSFKCINYFCKPCDDCKDKLMQFDKEIEAYDKKINKYMAKIKKQNEEISKNENHIKYLKNKIDSLDSKSNNFKIENTKLKEKLSKLKDEIIERDNENKKDKEKLNNYIKDYTKLETEKNNIEYTLQDKDQTIIELKEIITSKKEDNKKLKIKNSDLNNQIINLNNTLEKYKENLNEYKEKYNYIIIEKKNLEKKLQENINLKESEIKKLNNRISSLNEENKKLLEVLNEYKKISSNLKKENIHLYDEIKDGKKSLQDIKKDYREAQSQIENAEKKLKKIEDNADKSLKYQNLKAEDFYDLIIKCNSITGLIKGWDVLMNEKGKMNYYKYKDEKFTKIGVIGSENRGKSTILSNFSGLELRTGVTIKTDGLSIKYPELKEFPNRKFVLLDSAGLETPILNTEFLDQKNKNKNNIEKENKELAFLNGGDKVKENVRNENNIFESKSRNVILLELFLQTFIIKYSDMLLLILGKLTINEQRLLIKVKNYMKDVNRKNDLIVIHNLKEFETKKQVQEYIDTILTHSSTFELVPNSEINKDKDESDYKTYHEPNTSPKIYHLIYAKNGSEAGDFYNEKTIKYIFYKINLLTDQAKFDPIESIKNYFTEISKIILEKPLQPGDLIDNTKLNIKEENYSPNEINKILLNKQNNQIALKNVSINELGITNIEKNEFEVPYSYYLTDNNLYIYIELAGKDKDKKEEKIYENVFINYDHNLIKIKGKKKDSSESFIKDKINHFIHKRQFGEFNIEIEIDKNIELNKRFEKEIKNGCILLTFRREGKAIEMEL